MAFNFHARRGVRNKVFKPKRDRKGTMLHHVFLTIQHPVLAFADLVVPSIEKKY